MRERVLSLDFETCCAADLKKVGASKYSKDESLIVTVCAWAFDDGPIKSVVNPGRFQLELPLEIVEHIHNGGKIRAWNAAFETAILRNSFGLDIKPEQITCTMQRALYAGLPGALGDCGPALRLNIVKDATAHRLMLQMSRPRKHKGSKFSYWHIDDPDKLARLRAYCEQDVAAEREIAKYIPELPVREQKIAALDRRANERGIKLDVRLIEKMIKLADEATAEINAECAKITGGAVDSPGTQTAKLIAWLRGRGLAIDSLAKGLLEDAIQRADAECPGDKAVVDVLRLRQLAAKSSVKKLIAMQNCAEEDQCVRGVLAYYGASRTGRFAGRLLQPQNLQRPSFKAVNSAINFILHGGSMREIETVFPPMLETIASCIRGCIIPREGYRFVTPDLSQIEARMVAWLAGQDDILEVFARGDDVYTHTARKIGSDNRQLGKVLVLACGFGMSFAKFADTAAAYGLDLSLQYAEELVAKWREANDKIVQFWWDCDRVVRQTIRQAQQSPLGRAENSINKYVSVMVNKARNGSYLMTLLLPSGRRLFYRDTALELEDKAAERAAAHRAFACEEIDAAELADLLHAIDNRRERESITYSGVHQTTKKWSKIRTYGGKIAENLTQAAARDVICDMALEIDTRKLGELVLSVHDELVFEVPEGEAKERYAEIEKIMSTAPKWAPGLPVKSEGNIVERYGK